MNLEQALRAATAMKNESTNLVLPCAFAQSGLIVLVCCPDTNEAISNAGVSVWAEGTKSEESDDDQEPSKRRKLTVGDKTAMTDSNGIARFMPIAPGTYKVMITALPDAEGVLVPPAENTIQTVAPGDRPICAIQIRALARPSIKVVWMHDGGPVAQAVPTLTAGTAHVFGTPTGGDGVAAWDVDKPALDPGSYALTLTLDGNVKHELFGEDDMRLDAVLIRPGRSVTAVRARTLETMQIAVALRAPDGTVADVEGATVEVEWPDESKARKTFTTATVMAEAYAAIDDVPAVDGPATKCVVKSIELPAPSGAPAVYEFVALTTR